LLNGHSDALRFPLSLLVNAKKMKSVLLPLIILLAFAGFASAVKKHKPATSPSLQPGGAWEGQYAIGNGPFVNPLWFDLRPDNRIQVIDGPQEWGDRAEGTYQMSGDTLKAKYKFREGLQNIVTVLAIVRDDKIEGTWDWVKGKGKLVLKRNGNTIHR
jgi:hypothetical protein